VSRGESGGKERARFPGGSGGSCDVRAEPWWTPSLPAYRVVEILYLYCQYDIRHSWPTEV
jgi:hypothetical protein